MTDRPVREQFREAARTLAASWPLPSTQANALVAQIEQRREGDQSDA
jgi:hypothetical protein